MRRSSLPQQVILAPDVVLQVVDGEALLLKLQDEAVFSLNATGARIAELIAEGRSLSAVVDTLIGEYATRRDDVEDAVRDLVEALLSRGLVLRDVPERRE